MSEGMHIYRPNGSSGSRLGTSGNIIYLPAVQDANRNLRRGPLKHASIFLALCTSILLFLLLPLPLSKVRGYEELTDYRFPTSSCEATGFLSGGKWTFVGINIRVGQISFGQAKAADLAFNWAAGRGFQVVLVWLSYRVFTDALMRTTEMAYVPYDLFTSLALYSTKIDALWQLAKGLFTIRGWRVKAIVGWLLFSTAYLAAFPSLIDAMSGYEASMTTMLILPNMTVIDMTDVYSAWDSLIFNNCTNNTNPALVCFQFYDKTLQQSFDDSYQNDSYQFYAQDSNHIDCKADQNLYQWGFSAEWLLVVAIVNSFWLFGLWILWLDATTQSQLCRKGRRMGTYRAIADIAAVMREDLGPNLCAYSEAELTAAVRKQRPIKYFVSDEKGDEGAHIGLSSRPSGKVKLSWDQVYGHRRE